MHYLNTIAIDELVRTRNADIEAVRDSLLAALSLQQTSSPDRAQWDDRLQRLLRMQTLRRADRAFGGYAEANNEFDFRQRRLEEKCGRGYYPCTAAEAAENDLWSDYQKAAVTMEAAVDAHDAMVGDAYDEALRDLVLTPAPDVFAVRLKVELIIDRELDETWYGRAPMDVIKEDIARLAAVDAQ